MFALLWINKALRKSVFTVSNYLIVTFLVVTGVQVLACFLFEYKVAPIEYWAILMLFIIIAFITDFIASRLARMLVFNGKKMKHNHINYLMLKK